MLTFVLARPVWLVARREITTRLRSRAFLLSMVALLALIFGGVLFAGANAGGGFESTHRIAVTSDTAGVAARLGLETVKVDDATDAREHVESGQADAALLTDTQSPTGYKVIADQSVPPTLIQLLSAKPTVELIHPASTRMALAQVAGLAFGIIFMWSGITFGTTIAQSVVEEKQTRIIEILLATVHARVLFTGKVLGNAALALTTVILAIALSLLGLRITGQTLPLQDLAPAVVWFSLLFICGFVLLACLYGAVAALVSRQEDIGAVTSPISLLIMAPYVVVVTFATNPTVLAVMSYIPFSAPVGMPVRLFLGIVEPWEPYVALTVLIASLILIGGLGSRIYGNSVLRIGTRVKLTDAVRKRSEPPVGMVNHGTMAS